MIAVDFVNNTEDYDPDSSTPEWKHPLYLRNVEFFKDGTAKYHTGKNLVGEGYSKKWTKGYVLGAETAAAYTISDTDHRKILFLEWKSGDYQYIHRKPSYYVFKSIEDANRI